MTNPPYPSSPPKSSGFLVWIVVLVVAIPLLVAIVGVFASLAIYGVRKYLVNAKTAEARNSVGQLAKDAVTAFARDGKLCPSASSPVPADVPRGAKYLASPSEWEVDKAAHAGFACLQFSLSDPQYYQYDYKSTPTGFTITAHGDLNGDGDTSTFALEGHVSGGDINVAPNITETNPEE
jgi:type IV pilus assembly protein PilA